MTQKTQKPSLLRRGWQWALENPAKTTGMMAVPGELFMLSAGIQLDNPVLITSAISLGLGDTALLLHGDPKSTEDHIDDPQDQKVGLKRIYAWHKYPHEFASTYNTLGVIALTAAGIQIAGPELSSLPFLNYVTETARTIMDFPAGEHHVLGVDLKTVTGLMCLPGMALISLVPERSEAQIAEKQKQRALRQTTNGTALGKITQALTNKFNQVSDFVQQNVPLVAATSFQLSLIPYAIDGFLQPNLSETISILGSTAMFFMTNSFYAMSSKRVKHVPDTPAPQTPAQN